jgi:predicted nucleic acid-binding protein
MLVTDANVVVEAALDDGIDALEALGHELIAPWLLWSEIPAALSAMVFRGDISRTLGELALDRFAASGIEPCRPSRLMHEAWRLANELGWAKTYDAEYVTLARLLGCRLVTRDGPLWRRTKQFGFVITPDEI